ncbi:MAG: RluA family pseudouridine synthase [Clostridia bacterium]|nr:RluA family pseudouridine synthase [Clostridia bacterium]
MNILHEDNQIIVLEKPVGASSEEAQGENSVPALLRVHWGNEKAYVGVVHRLDTGVGGVMVYAKTPHAAAELSRQVQERTFEKEYRCVCAGIPEPAEGEMRDFLFKDSRKGKVFPVKGARKGAKEALLEYSVIQTGTLDDAEHTQVSLCRVILHTGRTHQVRVQFASRKHPLLGDGKYGSRVKGNIHLQCARIAFAHPKTKQRMEFSVEKPGEWTI